MKRFFLPLALVALLLSGCEFSYSTGDSDSSDTETVDSTTDEDLAKIDTPEEVPEYIDEEDLYFELANLAHVNGDSSYGIVTVSWEEAYDLYYLQVSVWEGLPLPAELPDGYFYEGWLVRNDPVEVMSTGPLTYDDENAKWAQIFTDSVDLSDHLQYIITLEPDDGDPEPADHVMETTFKGPGHGA